MKKIHFILLLILFVASKGTQAQSKSAFCFWNNGAFRTTPIFAAPDSLATDVPLYEGEPAKSFIEFAKERYGSKAQITCIAFKTREEALRTRNSQRATGSFTEIDWIYSPLKHGVHAGGAKPTEAEALYDAENFSGPFEDNQYKTIHSWDNHECTAKQVTGVAGSSKPSTFYQCTVTFSYSDTVSPVAKAAVGKGDTQDAAIAAAKSSANTVLLSGITWGQPLCSSFYTTVKNPYKADYGHTAGTKKESWACEVDFIGKK